MAPQGKQLIVLVGPTASGKTALAVKLAQTLHTEVLSADSRQFYKHLDIGTAKPGDEELHGVPHHFIDHLELEAHMSAGAFEQEALELLEELFQQHDHVLMTGGSGLYVDAVCRGFDDLPPADPALRAVLNERWETEGLQVLQQELATKDPATFTTIEQDNPHRIIRALEVLESTGKPLVEHRSGKKVERPFHIRKFGIQIDRELLYQRIDQRVHRMMDAGLLQEVKDLLPYRHLNALNTVGYKELFAYLDGQHSLDEAVELIKRNTRRYAKRQLTWWRKDDEIQWVGPDDAEQILQAN